MPKAKWINYRYYNRNPYKTEELDCVCRAISTATGLKYNAVKRLLVLSAKEHKCEKLCLDCYKHLLENVLGLKPHYCFGGETVADIVKRYKYGKVIIRIDGHLTCGIYGQVYDIWNCSHKKVTCYWLVD